MGVSLLSRVGLGLRQEVSLIYPSPEGPDKVVDKKTCPRPDPSEPVYVTLLRNRSLQI